MPRHEERERVRQRLGGLALRDKPGPGGARPAVPGAGTARTDAGTGGRWDDDELVPSTGEVRPPGWLDDGADTGGLRRFVPERFRGARVDPGRRGTMVLGVVGVVAVVLTGVLVVRDQPVAQSVPPVPMVRAERTSVPTEVVSAAHAVPGASQNTTAEVVVSVVGLVARPGLHRLPGDARVADAIDTAGGATDGADLAGLNLAQRLSDGDQIVVAAAAPDSGPRTSSVSGGAAGPSPNTPRTTSTGTAQAPKNRVNLNTATEAELDALPGVGPVTATAIITWRTTNGRFTDISQLGEVDGIGPARLARLRDLVTT
ncbi:helix-hairpin-helix domain-containing protein [Nocardia asteroides]|uniref:helix-hairpin-helix domain-containing protein n=1 Tax=Nocardia asteroides TaxID=1824 RepID=UPI003656AFB3